MEQDEERRRMEKVYSEHAMKYNLKSCVKKMEEMFTEALMEDEQWQSQEAGVDYAGY